MNLIQAEASRVLEATPEKVYQLLADYRVAHPSILPKDAFVGYNVEEGGNGAGTIISIRVRAGGRERPYRLHVTEPQPGHIIQEQDESSSLRTTFTMTPVDDGRKTNLTIATQWQGGSGVGGFFERSFAPMAMRNIYNKELDLIAAAVKK